MDLLSATLLGVIQGLTEFLPVSSSGHLLLARAFFGWDPGRFGLAFDVACHVGTLLAVVAYFRRDVWQLVEAAPGAVAGKSGEWHRLGRLILAGTIPIVIVGAVFADTIENTLRSPSVVAVTLVIGGVGLILAEWLGRKNQGVESLGYRDAVLVGLAQAAALAPGISRSGATITVAMLLGLRRATAARFVFLLSLPAVLAAAVKEAVEVGATGAGGLPVAILTTGLLVSAGVGYLTVKYFMRFLATHSLSGFAFYRFALAGVTLAWLMAR